jgi:ornithine carbamoyltransferase
MADMQTVIERQAKLVGTKWAWLGDGNNVLHSIIEAAGLMGFEVRASCPVGYDPDIDVVGAAVNRGAKIELVRDPARAVADADIVVTDTWISMGQADAAEKVAAMQPYQVDAALMAAAAPNATFLHCLPAHRGEEVVDAVIDGPASAIWDEAENRLHAQKAVLLWVLGKL